MENRDRFSAGIVEAATKYFGPINHKLSKQGVELRFGTHGSKSVDPRTAKWFDHEENVGGGLADLIKRCEPNADVAERMAQFGVPKSDAPKRIETVFDYCDENGEVRYQVVRIDTIEAGRSSKTYRQRKINPDTGKPEWGMLGVDPLPYRLDAIIARPKSKVFIVEGEKCVDALIRLGLTATTNHGGAGKWSPAISHWLEGRDVIIVPDNDAAGERHLHQVAGALSGVAASIKVLRLPNMQNKGDVADFIASGGTREAIVEMARAAPAYDSAETFDHAEDPAPATDGDADVFMLEGWDELKDVPVKWLVKDIIPARSFSALFGKPGSYKSFVALYLAAMIGTGNSAFGRDTEAGDVLYIAGEGGSGLKARRDALVTKYGVDKARIHFIRNQLNLRSTTDDVEKLIRSIEIAGLRPSLVIVDTLARAFGGGNENASEDMGAFIKNIGLIQERLETAVMIVHHSGKDEARGQRGHSSLLGAVDAELEVVKISEDDQDDRIGKLTITKQKDGEDGVEVGYRMDVINLSPLGLDERSSLAVEPIDAVPEKKKRPRKLTLDGQELKAAFDKALAEGGETVGVSNVPSDRKVVKKSLVRETFYMMTSRDSYETKKKAFSRGLGELSASGTLSHFSDYVWIPDTYEQKGRRDVKGRNGDVNLRPSGDVRDVKPLGYVPTSRTSPIDDRDGRADAAWKEFYDDRRSGLNMNEDDF